VETEISLSFSQEPAAETQQDAVKSSPRPYQTLPSKDAFSYNQPVCTKLSEILYDCKYLKLKLCMHLSFSGILNYMSNPHRFNRIKIIFVFIYFI
jgi:hypothetical protein